MYIVQHWCGMRIYLYLCIYININIYIYRIYIYPYTLWNPFLRLAVGLGLEFSRYLAFCAQTFEQLHRLGRRRAWQVRLQKKFILAALERLQGESGDALHQPQAGTTGLLFLVAASIYAMEALDFSESLAFVDPMGSLILSSCVGFDFMLSEAIWKSLP